MDAPHGRWLSIWRKRLTASVQEHYELYWTNPGGNIQQNYNCTSTYNPSRKPSKLDEADMQNSDGPLQMDEQGLCNRLEPIYNSYVLLHDIA